MCCASHRQMLGEEMLSRQVKRLRLSCVFHTRKNRNEVLFQAAMDVCSLLQRCGEGLSICSLFDDSTLEP
jgi:hypothetical protein